MNKIGIPDYYKDIEDLRNELKGEFAFVESEYFDEIDVIETSILGGGDCTAYCYCIFRLDDPKNKNYPPGIIVSSPFHCQISEWNICDEDDAAEKAAEVGLIIKVSHSGRYYSMTLDKFNEILYGHVHEILEKYIEKLN